MGNVAPGDSVVCRVKDGKIASIYDDASESKVFDIVSKCEEGYLIYIPSSLILKDSFLLTAANYKKYGADKKFIDSTVCLINDHKIIKVKNRIDGMCCARCGAFASMAVANVGDKFYCWTCRNYHNWEIT